jgi:hypothetical protein
MAAKWAQKTVVIPAQRRGCHLITPKVYFSRSISPEPRLTSTASSVQFRTSAFFWPRFYCSCTGCYRFWGRLRATSPGSSAAWRICSVCTDTPTWINLWSVPCSCLDDSGTYQKLLAVCIMLGSFLRKTDSSLTIKKQMWWNIAELGLISLVKIY